MRRIFACIFAIQALLLASPDAEGQVQALGGPDSFPTELGGFARGDIVNFESRTPGLGLGVQYDTPDVAGTLYSYSLGIPSVPDDPQAPALRQQVEQALGDVRATYAKTEIVEPPALGTGLCGRFWRVKLALTKDLSKPDEKLTSYLYVGSKWAKFFKIRVTYSSHLPAQQLELVERRFSQAACAT